MIVFKVKKLRLYESSSLEGRRLIQSCSFWLHQQMAAALPLFTAAWSLQTLSGSVICRCSYTQCCWCAHYRPFLDIPRQWLDSRHITHLAAAPLKPSSRLWLLDLTVGEQAKQARPCRIIVSWPDIHLSSPQSEWVKTRIFYRHKSTAHGVHATTQLNKNIEKLLKVTGVFKQQSSWIHDLYFVPSGGNPVVTFGYSKRTGWVLTLLLIRICLTQSGSMKPDFNTFCIDPMGQHHVGDPFALSTSTAACLHLSHSRKGSWS